MDTKNTIKVGDRGKIADGRIGVVIRVEKDPVAQGSTGLQQLVVRFPDQSTQVVKDSQFTPV